MAKAIKKAAGKKAQPKHEPGLLVIRSGRILLWPNGTKRAGAGTVVRDDDPYIKGYLATLTAAPKGSKPTPVEERQWIVAARLLGYNFETGYNKKAADAQIKKDAEEAELATGLVPTDPTDLPDAEA
jgi:hypothetical protein